jgi:multicomponent Na+:H+ antiporter subunit B
VRKIFALLMMTGLLVLLLSSFLEVPNQGSIDNPSYNDVARHYLRNPAKDTKSPNVVTGVIIDYRGFDTLGETTVLFTAIAAVLTVLRTHFGD